jgi:acetyl esterase
MFQVVAKAVFRMLFALPDGLLRKIFGESPAEAPGLRADSWAMGRLVGLVEDESTEPDPEQSRRKTDFLAGAVRISVPEVITQDWLLEGDHDPIDARLFTPRSQALAGPMLVHFHGGGWVQGSVDSHQGACSLLARTAGVRVLSVEYRLAPENPFPAQADDALAAWRSVMSDPARFGADPERVGVIGDSAGGQMAAVLCLDLKAAGEPQPACQVLIYPVTDCTGSFASRETFAEGFYLTKNRIDWFDKCFVPEAEAANPRVSPVFAEDLSGLAPALVSVSIADPLRDEGIAYGERLAEAGVPVIAEQMPMLHAWFNVTASRSSRRGHELLAARVNELLG